MSRSKRKTPILKICSCRPGEMKKWKKEANRLIRRGEDTPGRFSSYKKITDRWNSPDDGTFYAIKHWFFGICKDELKKNMRK